MPVLRTKTSRMWLPDALRGLALLNMLAYHAMYDWVYVFATKAAGTTSGPPAAMCGSNIFVGALFCCRGSASRWQSGPQRTG